MEWIFYIGVVLFILFGPWVLVWWANSRRKSERLEDQLRWADLTGRVHSLERELRDLRAQGAPTQPAARNEAVSEAPPPAVFTPAPAVTAPVPPSQAAAEAWVSRKTVEVPREAAPVVHQ